MQTTNRLRLAYLLATFLPLSLPAAHAAPLAKQPKIVRTQPAYPGMPTQPTGRYESPVNRLLREYPGDHRLQAACRQAASQQLAQAGITPNLPVSADDYEAAHQSAEQLCLTTVIRIRVAALMEHISLHNDARTINPARTMLSLPSTQDYPFLQSATQHGNEVEFVFNDVIPQLAGRKLVLLFSVEPFDANARQALARDQVDYPNGTKRLVFDSSPKTTMPPVFLLIPPKFIPVRALR